MLLTDMGNFQTVSASGLFFHIGNPTLVVAAARCSVNTVHAHAADTLPQVNAVYAQYFDASPPARMAYGVGTSSYLKQKNMLYYANMFCYSS